MRHLFAKITIIGFLLLTITTRLTSQDYALVKVKIITHLTGDALHYLEVTLESQTGSQVSVPQTWDMDDNGLIKLKAPLDKYELKVEHYLHEPFSMEVVISDYSEKELEITLLPYAKTKPYDAISGMWQAVNYFEHGKKVGNHEKIAYGWMQLSPIKNDIPGDLIWSSGCNTHASYPYRHIGKGVIEFNKKGRCSMTGMACGSPLDDRTLSDFIYNSLDQKIKTSISSNGQVLKLRYNNKKYVFRKKT